MKARWKLFANLKEEFHIRWESAVEWYLLKVDHANAHVAMYSEKYSQRFSQKFDKISSFADQSQRLVQVTLFGIIVAFTVLLFSCQTLPPARPVGNLQPQRFEAARPERELDQLYIKRNELTIRNTEQGSSTGSIWADAREPRSLVADLAPQREGQTITVLIPDELQFDPRSSQSDKDKSDNSKKNNKDKKTAAQDSKPSNGGPDLKLTDPDNASPSQSLVNKPIKSFKMQIIGFEPTGDVYLRGTRKFTGSNGEDHMTMVLAKVPRRLLTGFELDARELTDVAVNEDLGGRTREYSAPGWDEMVSRRLAGFTPDVDSELASLDTLREEIKTAQASLRDQAKANEMERERIRKERNRMAGQSVPSAPQTAESGKPETNTPAAAAKPNTPEGAK